MELTLGIRVLCDDSDADEIHTLAHRLRAELHDTEVGDVRQGTAGPAPAGAKSGEALAVGALVVTLAPTALEGLMTVVSSWLGRQPSEVSIEVDGQRFKGPVTRAQRDELVAAYLRRLDRTP
jgi:hypothetical protein